MRLLRSPCVLLSCQDGNVRCYDENGDFLAVVRLLLRSLLFRSLLSLPHGIRATTHDLAKPSRHNAATLKRLVSTGCSPSLCLLSCSSGAPFHNPLTTLARSFYVLVKVALRRTPRTHFTPPTHPLLLRSLSSAPFARPHSLGPSMLPSMLALLVRPSSFRS